MRYTVTEEPRGDTLAGLLAVAERWCPGALVVVRDDWLPLGAGGRAVLDRLAPHVTARQRSRSWPGTTLLRHEAEVVELRLDAALRAVLTTAADGLYDWQQPGLPEDLSLLRAGGEPWLTTTAHERDAYLDVTDDELAVLRAELPAFAATLRADRAPAG